MAVVGPGSRIQNGETPEPMLQGASEYEYVTILNPLTDDFVVQVAQDVPVNMPFEIRKDNSRKTSVATTDERMATLNYGLNLKNPDHTAHKSIFNTTIIPAGGTMNFKGSDAQVVVRQLITEIMQRRGTARKLHDPHAREEIEKKIIISRGSVQDLMDSNITSQQQQINKALNESNVPTVQTNENNLNGATNERTEVPKRGRPAKTANN